MTSTSDDDDVMFQGKWIGLESGMYWIPNEVAEQIVAHPPAPNTLFGKPIVMEDNQKHPGNCHNGPKSARDFGPNRDPNKHSEQCPMTQATMIVHGLTRNGACPTIRNPKKAK